ncbi:hypothetical protein [Brevibacillus sp. NL20B1]|jgi:hypothetical protein|uniref:hypothetical protein n=1 Tax=Brevibacillus sp. NL20B1 TaxID=2829799 RepID=UPI001B9ABB7C|nr:hypothetical protein [Brevibacillus sp. NL20B1]MBR8661129.1 hypothetical protein [Brevibacillus sp. NL20B1]
MAVNVTDADAYIAEWVVDNEDWTDADDAKKQRILNVAFRTLSVKYPTYVIPDEAVYETAAAFATAFNDTMVQAQRGVQSFSLSGVASFTFREAARDLVDLIPQTALDLIAEENPDLPKPAKRRVGWTVL